jgi:cell division protein FtsQ
MKKIIMISVWGVLITGVIILLVMLNNKNKNVACKGIEVYIDYQSEVYFITEDDVLDLIKSFEGDLKGKKMSEIKIFEIENLINSNPFVLKADVYATINGLIKINIQQRKPIVRIINNKNENFYIDDKGKEMPINIKYPSRTIIASGNIFDKYVSTVCLDTVGEKIYDSILKTTPLFKIYELAQFIDKDEFWKAQIDQIYLNNENEFELIPRVGNNIIIFGDTEDIKEKFEKLIIFYRKGLNMIGWNKYKYINLKFKNQVVCS